MLSVPRFLSMIVITAVALTGCANVGASLTTGAKPTTTATGPLTVENCGTSVDFDTVPERVVTIKSSTTEMLLALGLGDHIVGTAFQDGPVPSGWADAAANLPVLSDQVPSEEVVLETAPDLVYAGWESNFSADGAGERADLAALGIASYVSPSACRGDNQPPKITFESIFEDIEEVAAIFRVDASELITEQRSTLATIQKLGDGQTALWYSSGADTPYVGAGIGAPELLLETIGLTNIAADIDAAWAPLSWEFIVDANPNFIVLVDAAWNTADSKMVTLESNPATANLDAVKFRRYLIIPFAASEAGVRSVGAAADLATQLSQLAG